MTTTTTSLFIRLHHPKIPGACLWFNTSRIVCIERDEDDKRTLVHTDQKIYAVRETPEEITKEIYRLT
jgi:hypothetical protein